MTDATCVMRCSVKHLIDAKLSDVFDWSFDIFSLDRLTDGTLSVALCIHRVDRACAQPCGTRLYPGHTLYYVGFHMFNAFQLPERFAIDQVHLKNFLYGIESAYKQNPYHNSIQYVM